MTCPICSKKIVLLGKVDQDRDCLGLLPLPGEKFVDYYICTNCKFTHAPSMYTWTDKEFSNKIYNAQYINIDPDFKDKRPQIILKSLLEMFPDPKTINHLDYGGGTGILSYLLKENNWNSTYYDPHYTGLQYSAKISSYKFNLITAIEVFEHSNNPQKLMQDISNLFSNKGILLFTTILSDKRQSIDWDYIAPRNGHISLYSQQSLKLLAKQYNLNFRSFSETAHVMWKKVPNWALHLNLAA